MKINSKNQSILLNALLHDLNPQDTSHKLQTVKALRRWKLTTFCIAGCGLGRVIGNDVLFIVRYDAGEFSVGLKHFLVMTAALDRAAGPNFFGHLAEDLAFAAALFCGKFFCVFLDKGYVFDGFGQIPHSPFLVALLCVAMSDILELLAWDEEQRSAGFHGVVDLFGCLVIHFKINMNIL